MNRYIPVMHPSRYDPPFGDKPDPEIEEWPEPRSTLADWFARKWAPIVDFLGATKPLNLIAGACGIIAIVSLIAHAVS